MSWLLHFWDHGTTLHELRRGGVVISLGSAPILPSPTVRSEHNDPEEADKEERGPPIVTDVQVDDDVDEGGCSSGSDT